MQYNIITMIITRHTADNHNNTPSRQADESHIMITLCRYHPIQDCGHWYVRVWWRYFIIPRYRYYYYDWLLVDIRLVLYRIAYVRIGIVDRVPNSF